MVSKPGPTVGQGLQGFEQNTLEQRVLPGQASILSPMAAVGQAHQLMSEVRYQLGVGNVETIKLKQAYEKLSTVESLIPPRCREVLKRLQAGLSAIRERIHESVGLAQDPYAAAVANFQALEAAYAEAQQFVEQNELEQNPVMNAENRQVLERAGKVHDAIVQVLRAVKEESAALTQLAVSQSGPKTADRDEMFSDAPVEPGGEQTIDEQVFAALDDFVGIAPDTSRATDEQPTDTLPFPEVRQPDDQRQAA